MTGLLSSSRLRSSHLCSSKYGIVGQPYFNYTRLDAGRCKPSFAPSCFLKMRSPSLVEGLADVEAVHMQMCPYDSLLFAICREVSRTEIMGEAEVVANLSKATPVTCEATERTAFECQTPQAAQPCVSCSASRRVLLKIPGTLGPT